MALCRKIYGNMEVRTVSFGLLLFLFTLSKAASNCNYSQSLEPGKTYYAYNPEYSNEDEGEMHCMWQARYSDTIKVNCSIDITPSDECTKGWLSIQFAGDNNNEEKYCGSGTIDVKGMNVLTIKFDLSNDAQEGKFLCDIRAEKQSNENNCKCGWKKVTRIVGGNETGVNEYPMMGGLVDSKKKEIYCGCTIISHHCVVTAAHCIEKKNIPEIGVVVGEHDVTTGKETNATKLFRINNCTIHPKYNQENLQNDIAVCKIDGSITYSAEVGPACLPFQHKQDSFVGNNVTALGWGLLTFGGTKATKLQGVNLEVINIVNCTQYYSKVTNENICTYTSGKDACQMDSGGPLLWPDPTNHKLVLIGIIIGGSGCGGDEPGINTRIGSYIGWIESVCDEKYCKIE